MVFSIIAIIVIIAIIIWVIATYNNFITLGEGSQMDKHKLPMKPLILVAVFSELPPFLVVRKLRVVVVVVEERDK